MSTDFNDFEINDDLPVDENYRDADLTPPPPPPGNYSMKVNKFGIKKDKAGNVVLWKDSSGNPTYPVLQLQSMEITDPIDNARRFVPFQDISTAPFDRDGQRASRLGDMLRSLNTEATARNTGEILRQVSDLLAAGMEFKGRLDYEAYDSAFANAQFEARGGKENLTKQEQNEIYTKAKIRGARNIRKANAQAGQPTLPPHKWVGPSGNVVVARPVVTAFYPQTEKVKLGPDTL